MSFSLVQNGYFPAFSTKKATAFTALQIKLYKTFKSSGLNVHMSGSGPSLFIINPSKNDIEKVKKNKKDVKIIMVNEL